MISIKSKVAPLTFTGVKLLLAIAESEAASLQAVLSSFGFQMLPIPASPAEAVDLINQNHPDVILMSVDFVEPNGGLEAGKYFRDSYKVPVIYLLPESSQYKLPELISNGMDGLVTTPFNPLMLIGAVDIAIKHCHAIKKSLSRNRQLSAVLTSIGDAVITVDRDLKITFMNREAEHLTEHKLDEAFACDLFSILEVPDPGSEASARAIFEATLTSGMASALPDPTSLVGKRGAQLLSGDSVAPVLDESGAVTGLVIVFRSVLDARPDRNGGSSLQTSADFERMLDAVPISVFVTRNAEPEHVVGNLAAYELLRLAPGSDLGTALSRSNPSNFSFARGGKNLDAGNVLLREVAQTARAVRNAEYDIIFEDGVRRIIFGDSVPLMENGGRCEGSVSAFIDITERKMTEEALRRSNEELERFAGVVSHDLQEPLRTIMLQSDLLKRRQNESADSSVSDLVSSIHRTAERMRTLIEAVLDYSTSTSATSLTIQKTSTKEALQKAILNLDGSISDSGAEIVLSDKFPEVMADALRLPQVFQNIIGNAIKYRNPKRKLIVQVSAERRGADWVFSVKDNGTGFDQKQASRIFDVFRRLHGQDISGAGIGLAICKTTIQQLGGHIWAEGQSDVGACFYFTLPSADAVRDVA